MAEWIRKDLDPSCSQVVYWIEDAGDGGSYGYGGDWYPSTPSPTVVIEYRAAGMTEWDDMGRRTIRTTVYAGSLTELIERMDRQ